MTYVDTMGRRNECFLSTNCVAGTVLALHSILCARKLKDKEITSVVQDLAMDSSRICSIPEPTILPLFHIPSLSIISKCYYKVKLSLYQDVNTQT